jgi:hypothetical protein
MFHDAPPKNILVAPNKTKHVTSISNICYI